MIDDCRQSRLSAHGSAALYAGIEKVEKNGRGDIEMLSPMTPSAPRREFLKGVLATMAAGTATTACAPYDASDGAGPIPYVDPTVMAKLPFGTHSHYLQPWRSYLETVSASHFLKGIGVVLDGGPDTPDRSIEILARSGIAAARLEIPWSDLDFADERHLTREQPFRRVLAACRKCGLRPLIVLNAHHGLPTPARRFNGTVTTDAPAGSRTIKLHAAEPIVVGRTGLSDLTEFWAAEAIVTAVSGRRLTLSKPLPRSLRAGAVVDLATLAYEPFGKPGTPATDATLRGWVRYVDAVASFVAAALGTEDADDKGFDLEIWNELSFGAKFLSINNYYDPPLDTDRGDLVWAEIVARTAEWVSAHPTRFAGVAITNGFASTVPWPASSAQPAAVTGLSKHPYPRQLSFPADEQENTSCVGRDGSPTRFVPSYQAYFPEYFAAAIQTETIVRDMGPAENEIYGARHGRCARRIGGSPRPVPVWITEIGINPGEIGVSDPAAARALKVKAVARLLLFYLNKGAERVYVYSASGGASGYGLLSEDSPSAADDGASPSLAVIDRLRSAMRDGLDAGLQRTRSLAFAVHDAPASVQLFAGDGTPENPPLRNIDALALLPFQSNDRRLIIAHYFVTRDIRREIQAEAVTLDIFGLSAGASLRVYDPMADSWSDVRPPRAVENGMSVTLAITDAPRLLVVQE
jgi:hypothetical protein